MAAIRTTSVKSGRTSVMLRRKLVNVSVGTPVVDADLTLAEMTPEAYVETLPGLAFHWAAKNLANLYIDGNAVSSVRHLYPAGTNQPFAESTGVNQPLFKPLGIGNRPALLFDGTNDRLISDLGVVRQMDEVMTLLCVFQLSSTAARWMLLGQSSSAGNGGAILAGSRAASTFDKLTFWQTGAGEVAVGATALSTGVPYLGMWRRTGTTGNWTLEVYLNGGLDGTATTALAPTNEVTTTAVAAFGDTGGYYFNGLIAEQIAFTRALNATEIANLSSLLMAYYNIV